jgi:hypothetical protein
MLIDMSFYIHERKKMKKSDSRKSRQIRLKLITNPDRKPKHSNA